MIGSPSLVVFLWLTMIWSSHDLTWLFSWIDLTSSNFLSHLSLIHNSVSPNAMCALKICKDYSLLKFSFIMPNDRCCTSSLSRWDYGHRRNRWDITLLSVCTITYTISLFIRIYALNYSAMSQDFLDLR